MNVAWAFHLLVAIIGPLAVVQGSEAGTLTIDFRNPLTLYTATQRGVFKSDDGGATWAARTTGFPISERPPHVNALVMDPVNPRILYAGTQDLGVLKTTDGATTWVRTNTRLESITALAVDPATPTTLYAAAGQGSSGSPGRVDHLGKIYKSTDGGVTWRPSSAGVADPSISVLAVALQPPHTVYAVTALSGVVKSTDAGVTWRPAGAGITSAAISAFVIDPRTPDTLYAGTADRGVFKSVDGGTTWRLSDRGLTNKVVGALAIDRAAPSTIYAAATSRLAMDVFRSVDGGSSWTLMSTVPAHGHAAHGHAALAIDPVTPSTLYLAQADDYGGSGHVFKSRDAGGTWQRAETGLAEVAAYSLAVDPISPAVLYAGVSVDGRPGVFKSADGGMNWVRSHAAGLDALAILMPDPRTPSTLYAGTDRGVFKSADGGARWTASSAGLPAHDSIGALAIDPNDSSTVYVGTGNGGVFKSSDGGRSWRASGTGLNGPGVLALVVDPHHSATLYAVLAGGPGGPGSGGGPQPRSRIGGVFKSVDGGGTWSGSDAGLPPLVQSIVVDPRAPGVLHASVSPGGIPFSGDRPKAPPGVFLSTDGGATWTADDRGLTGVEVLGLAITSQSTVYARTTSGIFRMTQRRGAWIPVNTGLPNPSTLHILALAADPRNPRILYAGTATHGIFKSVDGGDTWFAANAGLSAPEVVAPPAPGLSQGKVKLIQTLEGPARSIVEGLGIGERTQISRSEDCNGCSCAVRRISPTEYHELECVCTRMACPRTRTP